MTRVEELDKRIEELRAERNALRDKERQDKSEFFINRAKAAVGKYFKTETSYYTEYSFVKYEGPDGLVRMCEDVSEDRTFCNIITVEYEYLWDGEHFFSDELKEITKEEFEAAKDRIIDLLFGNLK